MKELEGMELWLTFIKKAGEEGTEDLLRELIERSDKLKMANEMLEGISADELLRQKYYAQEKARMDEISRIKYAEEKGMARGMEKGMQEGLEKGVEEGIKKGKVEGIIGERMKIAKNLLIKEYGVEQISEITELTPEEIIELKKGI